ncbi:MAG: amidohydrolase family protein [Candidatus Limnocylindrales bacterium]|jgi:L-fuconolactonase
MAIVVDAHHHFWDTSDRTYDYYWMTDELAAIRGRFGPDDMRPLLAARGIDRTVLIQTIPSLPETEQFLATAAATDFVAGVVGWVDLTDPDVASTLARLKARPDGRKLVGIRHQAHDEPDPDWLRRPDVQRGIGAVGEAGLTYDVLVRSRELPAALDLVRAFPENSFVIDHIAKPCIREHEIEPWASRMAPLAAFPKVWVKLSGMIEEDDWASWTADDLKPYVQRLLDWFGPGRLIFGSNWPVCLLAGSYARVFDALVEALGDIPRRDRERIFGANALEAYRLDHRP